MKNVLVIVITLALSAGLFGSTQGYAQQISVIPAPLPGLSGADRFQVDSWQESVSAAQMENLMKEALRDMPALSFPSWQDAINRHRVEQAIYGAS